MITMIVISAVAVLTAIIGCALIWGFDARRAEEVSHRHAPATVPVSGERKRL